MSSQKIVDNMDRRGSLDLKDKSLPPLPVTSSQKSNSQREGQNHIKPRLTQDNNSIINALKYESAATSNLINSSSQYSIEEPKQQQEGDAHQSQRTLSDRIRKTLNRTVGSGAGRDRTKANSLSRSKDVSLDQRQITDIQSSNSTQSQPLLTSCAGRKLTARLQYPSPPVPSILTLLPVGLTRLILNHLDDKSLCALSQVSLNYHQLANDNALWFDRCVSQGWHSIAYLPKHVTNDFQSSDIDASALGSESSGRLLWKNIYAAHYKANKLWMIGQFRMTQIGHETLVRAPQPGHEQSKSAHMPLQQQQSLQQQSSQQSSHERQSSQHRREGSLGLGGRAGLPRPRHRSSSVVKLSSGAQAFLQSQTQETHKMVELVKTDPAHRYVIHHLKLDGEYCYTSCRGGKLRLWQLDDKTAQFEISAPFERAWNVDQENQFSDQEILSAVYVFDVMDNLIVAGFRNGDVGIYSCLHGKQLAYKERVHIDGVSCLQFIRCHSESNETLDGNGDIMARCPRFITCGFDGRVVKWSIMRSGKATEFQQNPQLMQIVKQFDILAQKQGVFSLECCDKFAFVGGSQNVIQMYDLNTMKCLRTFSGHCDTIVSLSVSNDQLLVSTSMDKTLKVWSIQDGTCVYTVSDGHVIKCAQMQWIKALSSHRLVYTTFSGKIIVKHVSKDGRSVKDLWQTMMPQEYRAFDKRNLPVMATSMEFDDFQLVMGDQTGRLWRMMFYEQLQ
ncbi:hypothetical protein MP228_011767 [Amoeboaphelidium protococcarum]|nr:hypothetical protein MP228_011767 [Amoeboaphelidium protococcarum]